MNISKEKIDKCLKKINIIIQNEGKINEETKNSITNGNLKLKNIIKTVLINYNRNTMYAKLFDDYDEAYDILYTIGKSENKKEAESQLKEYIGDQYEYADHYFTKYNELSEEEQQNNKYNNFIKTAIEIKFPVEVDYNVNDYDDNV